MVSQPLILTAPVTAASADRSSNPTTDPVSQTGSPTPSGQGRVWFVSPTGDDANDGATAETPFQSLLRAPSAASAGDVILLNSGVFNLGDQVLNVPDGVSLVGLGPKRTHIIGSAGYYDGGCVVRPPSNGLIANLSIADVATDRFGAPLGAYASFGEPGQPAFTNALLYNVTLSGQTDGIYIDTSGYCSLEADQVTINTHWDAVFVTRDNGRHGGSISLNHFHILSTGDSPLLSGGGNFSLGVGMDSGSRTSSIQLSNGTISAFTSGLNSAYAIHVNAGTLGLANVTITSSGGIDSCDIFQEQNATVTVNNVTCQTTWGTILTDPAPAPDPTQITPDVFSQAQIVSLQLGQPGAVMANSVRWSDVPVIQASGTGILPVSELSGGPIAPLLPSAS